MLVCVRSLQSGLTLWDPKDCSPPGSSVHGILQARILEWVAISFFYIYNSFLFLNQLTYYWRVTLYRILLFLYISFLRLFISMKQSFSEASAANLLCVSSVRVESLDSLQTPGLPEMALDRLESHLSQCDGAWTIRIKNKVTSVKNKSNTFLSFNPQYLWQSPTRL